MLGTTWGWQGLKDTIFSVGWAGWTMFIRLNAFKFRVCSVCLIIQGLRRDFIIQSGADAVLMTFILRTFNHKSAVLEILFMAGQRWNATNSAHGTVKVFTKKSHLQARGSAARALTRERNLFSEPRAWALFLSVRALPDGAGWRMSGYHTWDLTLSVTRYYCYVMLWHCEFDTVVVCCRA